MMGWHIGADTDAPQIQFESIERRPELPTRFDRIHTSNVPEYVYVCLIG
jgi:hypothetical protein